MKVVIPFNKETKPPISTRILKKKNNKEKIASGPESIKPSNINEK